MTADELDDLTLEADRYRIRLRFAPGRMRPADVREAARQLAFRYSRLAAHYRQLADADDPVRPVSYPEAPLDPRD